MGKHDALTKTMALVGTVLVALPLVAPFLLGIGSIGSPRGFGIDYLLPFEVYFVTLVGMALVLGAALRARDRRAAVGTCIAVMLGGVLLGAASATLTGIADSEETLETWRYVVTAGFGVLSLIGQAALVVVGSLLVRDTFARHEDAPPLGAAPTG